MTAQNHIPSGPDRNLDNPSDRRSVREDGYLSEDPSTWLRPGDRLMSGGYDWAWCYVWFEGVPGFPGYGAGSNGTVWSRRLVGCRGGIGEQWSQIAPAYDRKGYHFVGLYRDRRRSLRFVHRVVLETFVGPRSSDLECLHGDRNPINNALWNLAWGTRSQNVADKIRHGTISRGSHRPLARLREQDVTVIRELKASGWSQDAIAKRFGVAQSNISLILGGKTWKHVV